MAELDFSHRVGEVPAGAQLPNAIPRTEKTDISTIPDFQSAASNYGAATNWMSTFGSGLAVKASNAIATKMGNEAGKNPQGDIYPITDFDKVFAESYNQQAQSTLALQADKLITDANIEMAKAPRLSPDLIQKTNTQISVGLQNIFKNAPAEIRPNLEYQFGNQQLTQVEQATKRMIGENREDAKDHLIASNTQQNQSAYQLGRASNEKAAQAVVESVIKSNQAALAVHVITEAGAQQAIEAAQKSADAGVYGAKADAARAAGKYEEFAKNLAEKKPSGMSYDRWESVMTNVSNENAQIHNMKMQSEQLELSKFKLSILENPNAPDIAAKLQDLKDKVSNNSFVEAQISLLKIQETANKANNKANDLANNWQNINAYNDASATDRDKAFRMLTNASLVDAKNRGVNLSEPEAEMNVALNAPGPIKSYVDKLNTNIHSGNPQLMDESGYAIEHIHSANKGDILNGIDDKSMSMLDKYNALKQQMPSLEAAAEAKRVVYGPHSEEESKALQEAWSNHLKQRKSKGETDVHFFFRMAGLSQTDFVRFPDAYGKQLENTYHAYFDNLQGDAITAQKQLQRTVSQVYGYTTINGHDKEYTLYPIEQSLGLPQSAKGLILNDVADQITKQFDFTNQKFKEGKSDWFFEVVPRPSFMDITNAVHIKKEFSKSTTVKQGAYEKRLALLNNDKGVEVLQHFRDGSVKKYQTVIQASPFATKTVDANNPIVGGYDVMLKNDEGTKNISTLNPLSGGVTYHPDITKIKNEHAYIHIVNRIE